jgi:hypothetical protein
VKLFIPGMVGLISIEVIGQIPRIEKWQIIFQVLILIATLFFIVREKWQFKKNCDKCLYFRHYFIDKRNNESIKGDKK